MEKKQPENTTLEKSSRTAVKNHNFSDKMRPLVRVWVVAPVTDGLANQA